MNFGRLRTTGLRCDGERSSEELRVTMDLTHDHIRFAPLGYIVHRDGSSQHSESTLAALGLRALTVDLQSEANAALWILAMSGLMHAIFKITDG